MLTNFRKEESCVVIKIQEADNAEPSALPNVPVVLSTAERGLRIAGTALTIADPHQNLGVQLSTRGQNTMALWFGPMSHSPTCYCKCPLKSPKYLSKRKQYFRGLDKQYCLSKPWSWY